MLTVGLKFWKRMAYHVLSYSLDHGFELWDIFFQSLYLLKQFSFPNIKPNRLQFDILQDKIWMISATFELGPHIFLFFTLFLLNQGGNVFNFVTLLSEGLRNEKKKKKTFQSPPKIPNEILLNCTSSFCSSYDETSKTEIYLLPAKNIRPLSIPYKIDFFPFSFLLFIMLNFR